MYKYISVILLLVSTCVFADTGGIYHTDVMSTLPTDAKCASGDADVKIIDEDSDWDDINSSTFTIFCVEPGDYTAKNIPNITENGTSGTRRYIRYYNSSETYQEHPYLMADGDRAKVTELHFITTEYWTVDRIYVDGEVSDAPIRIQSGADNIIINRVVVTQGHMGAGMIAHGGDDNLVQNSVLFDTALLEEVDDHCITFGGSNMKVVGNEIFDCSGNALQSVASSSVGGLIADNAMYASPAQRTDCSASPVTFDPDGACNCMELAMGLKGGGGGSFPWSASTELLIAGNKIWGFDRGNDPSCSGAGTGTVAIPVAWLEESDGIRFQDNVMWTGPENVTSQAITSTGALKEGWSQINNLIYGFNRGISVPSGQTINNEFYYNTWLNIGLGNSDTEMWHFGAEDENDWLCNVLINVPDEGNSAAGSSSVYGYNAFYNSERDTIAGINDYVAASDSAADNEKFCWMQYQITNPTEQCVSMASTTVDSPHGAICNSPTESTGRGVDDTTRLTRVRAGFVAPHLERTMEYEESSDGTFKFVAPVKDEYQFWFRATTTDTDDNSLSYSLTKGGISVSGSQTVSFEYPATTWEKSKVNLILEAGMHTLSVVKRDAGIAIDKMIVTNNPAFVSP